MSGMLRSRGPLLAGIAGLGGLLYWQTRGGVQQPNSRGDKPASQQASVSESFQSAGSEGGKNATGGGSDVYDDKDTRLYSRSPDAASKKNPDKARASDKN